MSAGPRKATAIEDVRTQMQASADTKVVRTRQAIVDAVEILVADGNGPVTVSDIVRTARISRGAFYTHFAGLDDLAVVILRSTFVDIGAMDLAAREDETIPAALTAHATIRRITEHLLDHRALYLGALDLPRSSRAYDAALEILVEHARNAIAATPGRPADLDPDDAARFIGSGTLALLVNWMRQPQRPPVEEMSSRILALLPTWGR